MSGEKRFTLRMDGDLFEEISRMAKKNRRSIAKEVETAIATYLMQLEEKSLLDELDTESTSNETAIEHLKKIKSIKTKYGNFME